VVSKENLCVKGFTDFLFILSFNKDIKVDRVIGSFGSCILFRRTLWGDLAKEWFDHTVLRDGKDRVSWKLGQKGFTIKSLYNALQVRQLQNVVGYDVQ
jgi:hypothetical protein